GAHIGSSDELRAESNEGLAESDATKDKSPSSEDAAADLVESPAEPGVESEQTEPREAHLARAALHELTGDTNHLGLAFALSERTSDLHWVLAIENRSPHPVRLAALPELLRFSVSKSASSEGDPGAVKRIQCGTEKLPTKLSDDDFIELRSGELIFHAFDPRPLCKDDSVLEQDRKSTRLNSSHVKIS